MLFVQRWINAIPGDAVLWAQTSLTTCVQLANAQGFPSQSDIAAANAAITANVTGHPSSPSDSTIASVNAGGGANGGGNANGANSVIAAGLGSGSGGAVVGATRGILDTAGHGEVQTTIAQLAEGELIILNDYIDVDYTFIYISKLLILVGRI
ncbi:unnamed protein product [Protopolystoma xenopodis]|uniref:Uncharacterized protein n=1 Tax=Protopolystoma xenopodis TaxID=117903 RepID=A0A448WFC2_9PLAT|nr:unnamed protein product [Protopolystoma xenopodis]